MADEKNAPTEVSGPELAAESGAELPDREALSLMNANVTAPVNAAVAANVLSDGAFASANAEQDVDVEQSTGAQNP